MLLGFGDHRLGVTICSEAIDAELVRRPVQEGADLLVNLAHDGWFGMARTPRTLSPYSRYGDVFGWGCIAITLGLVPVCGSRPAWAREKPSDTS